MISISRSKSRSVSSVPLMRATGLLVMPSPGSGWGSRPASRLAPHSLPPSAALPRERGTRPVPQPAQTASPASIVNTASIVIPSSLVIPSNARDLGVFCLQFAIFTLVLTFGADFQRRPSPVD